MTGRLANMKHAVVEREPKCIHIKDDGIRCNKFALTSLTVCQSHLTGAPRPSATGLYSSALDSSMKKIEAEVIRMDLHDELRKPDLTEELALARMMVMELLQDQGPQGNPKNKMRALDVIRKIAIAAKQMEEIRSSAMNAEFLESVLNAIAFSFERANGLADPSERTVKFLKELSTFFPDVNFQGSDNEEEKYDPEETTIEGTFTEIDPEEGEYVSSTEYVAPESPSTEAEPSSNSAGENLTSLEPVTN